MEQFIELCIVLGCDYAGTIRGTRLDVNIQFLPNISCYLNFVNVIKACSFSAYTIMA